MKNNIYIDEMSPPIDKEIVNNLSVFWGNSFGNKLNPDLSKEVFLGSENEYNSTKVYLYS